MTHCILLNGDFMNRTETLRFEHRPMRSQHLRLRMGSKHPSDDRKTQGNSRSPKKVEQNPWVTSQHPNAPNRNIETQCKNLSIFMDLKMDLKNADTVLWRHLSLPKLHWSENGAQIRWSGYVNPPLILMIPGLHWCRKATACRLVKYGLKSFHDALYSSKKRGAAQHVNPCKSYMFWRDIWREFENASPQTDSTKAGTCLSLKSKCLGSIPKIFLLPHRLCPHAPEPQSTQETTTTTKTRARDSMTC